MIRQMKLFTKFLNHFFSRYQTGLEISMRGTDVIFDSVHLLCYKCHKINLNNGGTYIDFPNWIKIKKIPSIRKIINVFNTLEQSH